jgi:hypothetical protein
MRPLNLSVHSIEKQGDLYQIDCEEHGMVYPGWRTFDRLPQLLKRPLGLLMAATSELDCDKLDGIGEKKSSWEYLIY